MDGYMDRWMRTWIRGCRVAGRICSEQKTHGEMKEWTDKRTDYPTEGGIK